MPDPTPQIVELSNQFRARLLQRERQAATQMVRYYGATWQRLQGDISTLTADIQARKATGETIGPGTIWRLERMQAIQQQAAAELGRFAGFAGTTVTAGQREAMAAGSRDAAALVQASFLPEMGITVNFAQMPRAAVEQMAGFLADGSPLNEVIGKYASGAVDKFGETLVTGLAMGWNPRKLARELRSSFGMGLTDSLRLARTEQLRAYRTAALNTYRANSHVVNGWERHAQLDTRTCLACLVLDGTRYKLEQEMDDHVQGRCLAPNMLVHGRSVEAFVARHYEGEMLDIKLASGQFISVTPNHPILTVRGWMVAKLLQHGDDVVCHRFLDGAAPDVGPDENRMPTRVQDIPGALGMSRLASVPGAAENFHGDGIDGEVYVVWANGTLKHRGLIAGTQPRGKQVLGGRGIGLSLLTGLSDMSAMRLSLLSSASRFLRDLDAAVMLLYWSLFGQQLIGCGLGTAGDTLTVQAGFNSAARNAIGTGQGVLGFARQIPTGNLSAGQVQVRHSGGGDFGGSQAIPLLSGAEQAAGLEFGDQPTGAGMELGGGDIGTLARHVCFDRILDISSRSFSGHVYNLQTRDGWYNAGGSIHQHGRCVKLPIMHNCAMLPITKTYAELGIDAPEPDFSREKGIDWFRRQSEADQVGIMGRGKWQAWKDGLFDLQAVPKLIKSDVWGDSWVVSSLKDLVGATGAVVPITFQEAPEKLLAHYGYRSASEAERRAFQESLTEIPDEVKRLWKGQDPVLLAISQTEAQMGRHKGNWIMLGSESHQGGVARHEFIHHIVGQSEIKRKLGAYNTGEMFNHAAIAPDWQTQRDEDLTMMLDAYRPGAGAWQDNLMGDYHTLMADGTPMTAEQAERKIHNVRAFLEGLGEW